MLEAVLRADGGRIIAALAARFRDLDLAEDALAEAYARAVSAWAGAPPANPAGWLYRVATRVALDSLRRSAVRQAAALPDPEPEPTVEDLMTAAPLIPDERLRLIFVCCHPAIHPDARAALTLRLVCGLSAQEISRAFLIAEPALLQRLTRAKRKIADAGVPFEVPGPDHWNERFDAVLSTLEIAYAHAHADGAGTGRHAGYAEEMLGITAALAAMLPTEPEVQALAAIVRFAEARRPARVDGDGMMVPLAEQDPMLWDAPLIADGRRYLAGVLTHPLRARGIQALIHAEWCARASLADPAPWPAILTLYDALLACRDDPVTRLNRAVALAEVRGPAVALEDVDALSHAGLADYLPYHASRANLLARLGLADAARRAYDAALALAPAGAERRWLDRGRSKCMD
jgi:RNA polymerase sigma-70 factor (ECF subfamily)